MKLLLSILGLLISIQGLEPKMVLNNKVELLMPSSFDVMPEDMLMVKYPSGNRPTLVYSNEDGTVNLGINHTANKMSLEQLSEAKGTFVGQFQQIYPTAQWYRKELTKINGRDFIVLELVTPAIDTQIYNLMFITSLEGRMLMFSFNCTKPQMGEWQSTGQQIMESVKIL